MFFKTTEPAAAPASNPAALTQGTVWQANAITGLAKQLLAEKDSRAARVALAKGIIDCAQAIVDHEAAEATPVPAPVAAGPLPAAASAKA